MDDQLQLWMWLSNNEKVLFILQLVDPQILSKDSKEL